MQRRTLLLLLILFAILMRAHAQDPKKDEFDCHLDEITDSYFCNSGPLEGREFVSKSELDDAIEAYKIKQKERASLRPEEMLSPDPQEPKAEHKDEQTAAAPREPRLKVMTWNVKALSGEGADYDRAALVLAKADVIALQEVDLSGQGKGFLNVIGNLIQAKIQEKVCRAWVQSGSGERQTLGFLWKESAIGFVDNDGGIQESCGDSARVIRQLKKTKLVGQATFYFKPQKKMFVLGTTFLDKKPKAPEKSVNEVFKALDEGKWPIVLAGDFKMGAGNPAFAQARKMGFRSAVSGNPKAWDNLWYRGAVLAQAGQVDLYRQFADARHEDIERDFSGVFPLLAEFSLREETPKDSVTVVSKKAAAPAAASAKKKTKSSAPARARR